MAKAKPKPVKPAQSKQEDHLIYFGESFHEALLLDTIIASCSSDGGKSINSKSVRAYTRSICELDAWGLVTIQNVEADGIAATITDKGAAYIAQLLKDDEEERAENGR